MTSKPASIRRVTRDGAAPAITATDIVSYPTALRFLHDRADIERMRTIRYDQKTFKLDRMRDLLERMGNPHEQVKTVHVAGTVGKGSTVAMIAHMLRGCGYTVGEYTSPHLVDVRERIRIDGQMIGRNEFVEGMKEVALAARKLESEPTFFEILTALAFRHFADQAIDIAVIEVGLGGRLDSTNVVVPEVSVVCTIDHDHNRLLGQTLPEIAREKAGIFKKGVPALIHEQAEEIEAVFREVAAKVGAPLRVVNKDIEYSARFCSTPDLGPHTRVCLFTETSRFEHLPVPLAGEHQAVNCGLALAAVDVLRSRGFDCPEEKITSGLAETKVPGRMQLLSERPRILVDGAHNAAAVGALMRCVGAHVPYDSMVCIFGCCADKDVGTLLDRVNLGADKVVFTRASSNPRAADPDELQRLFQERSGKMSQVARAFPQALELALSAVSREDLIVVTGSFYLVGDAMRHLQERGVPQKPRSGAAGGGRGAIPAPRGNGAASPGAGRHAPGPAPRSASRPSARPEAADDPARAVAEARAPQRQAPRSDLKTQPRSDFRAESAPEKRPNQKPDQKPDLRPDLRPEAKAAAKAAARPGGLAASAAASARSGRPAGERAHDRAELSKAASARRAGGE
ncbi:MAG TPA: Mur ligase family protein [Phycisphaerales bacterium]|nr:Mur ligase family protein [Phycisphaerales bacterium]HMP36139.1 Mur ligase family protein [Phycisphaerales bacterium]